MTLLIAVADTEADRELVVSARCLANAAGWDARAVHVREAGGPELDSADAAGLEIVDLEGDAPAELARLVGNSDVDAVALGLRSGAGPSIGHVTEALMAGFSAPLLLVRHGMRPLTTLRRLVVPLEGSPSASAAMRHADGALCARGREIVMLHVVTGSTPDERGSVPAPRIVDQSTTSGPPGRTSSACASRSARRAAATACACASATRPGPSSRKLGRTAPSSSCCHGKAASPRATAPS